ncbi:MAG UNVERIFIED_CONTAM: IS630 transposase-related protein [Rickettsiaceae bacterium]|jgi:transposase
MTYSVHFRKKVLKIKQEEKLSFVEVASRFGLSKTTVFKWSKNLEPKTKRNKPATKIDMEALKMDIEKFPDAYHYERAARLGSKSSSICDAIFRLGVTYKKNSKSPESGSRKKIYILPKDSSLKK